MSLLDLFRTAEERASRCIAIQQEIDTASNELTLLKSEYDTLVKAHDLNIGLLNNKLTIVKSLDDKNQGVFLQKKLLQRVGELHNDFEKSVFKQTRKVYKLKQELAGLLRNEEVLDLYKSMQNKNLLGDSYELIKTSFLDGQVTKDKFKAVRKKAEKVLNLVVKYADMLVHNNKGELLLLKRNANDDMFPDMWCLPGGHVDPNEEFKVAAIRELAEETLIELDADALVNKVAELKKDKVNIEYFQVYLNNTPNLVINNREHCEYKWVSIDKLPEYEFLADLGTVLGEVFINTGQTISVKKGEAQTLLMDALEQGLISIDVIEKGRKYEVGQVSQKTGLKKVGPNKWVDPKTGKVVNQDEKGKKDEVKKEKDLPIEDYAKQSSEDALTNAAKSGDEELRLAAKKELQRRETEESFEEPEADEQGKEVEKVNKIQSYWDGIISLTSGKQKEFFEKKRELAKPVEVGKLADVLSEEQVALLGESRGFEKKQCYSNAVRVCNLIDGAEYVEGEVIIMGAIPISHAWNKIGDKYFDVTTELVLKDKTGFTDYTSVLEFDHNKVNKMMLETGVYGEWFPYYYQKELEKDKKQE